MHKFSLVYSDTVFVDFHLGNAPYQCIVTWSKTRSCWELGRTVQTPITAKAAVTLLKEMGVYQTIIFGVEK